MADRAHLIAFLNSVILSLLLVTPDVQAANLNAVAAHDIPGPVQARVQGWDATCDELFDVVLEWPDNNNTYGTKSIVGINAPTTVRFWFINDYFGGGNQDTDRNLFLDEWDIDGGTPIQGENWDRSYGPDPQFPGCGMINIFGRDVTDCGNQYDWAEYGPGCPESDCLDGIDNNGDGLTDCEDTACFGIGGCEIPEQTCDDGRDNDGDGDTDCADTNCNGVGICEMPEQTCADGLDNDGDGKTDCADPDCNGIGTCEMPEQTCDDGIDNDADGLRDCSDPDCPAPCGTPASSPWSIALLVALLLAISVLAISRIDRTRRPTA